MGELKLRPHAAEKWIPCPGSAGLEVQYPDTREKGPVVAEGVAADWLAYRVLASRWDTNDWPPIAAADLVGLPADNGVIVTPELAGHTQAYVDAMIAAAGSANAIQLEKQIGLTHLGLASGRCDVTFTTDGGRHRHVWDHKYGYRLVDPVGHWQLLLYAAGLPRLNVERFTLAIYQPRGHGATYKPWTITPARLDQFVTAIESSIESARSGAPRFQPGTQCQICSARHACGYLAQSVGAAMDYASAPAPVDPSGDAIALELNLLDGMVDLIKARKSGMETIAEHRLMAGQLVGRFGLVPTEGNRRWRDKAAARRVGEVFGVPLDKEPDVCSPNQANGRGLPKAITECLVTRAAGGHKLQQITLEEVERAFSNGAAD